MEVGAKSAGNHRIDRNQIQSKLITTLCAGLATSDFWSVALKLKAYNESI
jgi:hypothetical protein